MPNRLPTRRALLGLMAVAVLGLVVLAAWPREPTYKGRRLSSWIDELGRSQEEGESPSDVRLRYQTLTNTVQSLGSKAASMAVAWIRDKPRKSLYDDIQYSIENALRARIRLPSRKDRSGDAIWVFQILGPTAKQAIPDLSTLALSDYTCGHAARCLSCLGPEAMPALSNTVVNGSVPVRSAAIDALAELGPSAVTTASLLHQLVSTNDRATWQALRALVEITTNAASLLPTMRQYLEATNAGPVSPQDFGPAPGAAYALARIGADSTPFLLQALASTQAVIRASAKAAFEPRLQDMLTGKFPSDFYARSGCYQAAFGRDMISEATAKTLGQLPEPYLRQLCAIADRYKASTNEPTRTAAAALASHLAALSTATNAPPAPE